MKKHNRIHLSSKQQCLLTYKCDYSRLPPEIWGNICSYLDINSLKKLTYISHFIKFQSQRELVRRLIFRLTSQIKIPRMTLCPLFDNLTLEHTLTLYDHLYRYHKSDEILNDICTLCPSIWKINLFHSDITNDGIKTLSTLSNLTYFCLDACNGGIHLESIPRKCHKLKHFETPFLWKLTDDIIILLGQNCHDLQILHIRCCELITDNSIMSLVNKCHQLVSLDFYGVKLLTNLSCVEIARYCPLLEKINLTKCSSIGDYGIKALADGCPLLTTVELSNTDVSDDGIVYLAEHCQLEKIILRYCNVTDNGIFNLIINSSRLIHINLGNCVHLTDVTVQNLKTYCPNLKLLNLCHCHLLTDVSCDILKTFFSLEIINILMCPLLSREKVYHICYLPNLKCLHSRYFKNSHFC